MSWVNWNVIKQPINWVTVILMLLFAAFGADILSRAVTSIDTQEQ